MYSRQATESVNFENSWVSFVMNYCPTSTVVRNPASVHNLITRFCWDSLSTRSWYICNRSSCARQKCVCLHLTWHKQRVRLSCQNMSPCSNMAGFTFFTQIWDCSVNTELINSNNCAKNSFNRSLVSAKMYWQFSRGTENWVSAFCTFYHHLFSNSVLFSLWFVFV